jgi:hypothetical protein
MLMETSSHDPSSRQFRERADGHRCSAQSDFREGSFSPDSPDQQERLRVLRTFTRDIANPTRYRIVSSGADSNLSFGRRQVFETGEESEDEEQVTDATGCVRA